jgi:desulfoferrodoxin-like iron-binding protein
MSVKSVNEKFRCNICGNEVIVTKMGGGTLVCCGEDMELVGPGKKGNSLMEEGYEIDGEKGPKEDEDGEEIEEEDTEEDEGEET